MPARNAAKEGETETVSTEVDMPGINAIRVRIHRSDVFEYLGTFIVDSLLRDHQHNAL